MAAVPDLNRGLDSLGAIMLHRDAKWFKPLHELHVLPHGSVHKIYSYLQIYIVSLFA